MAEPTPSQERKIISSEDQEKKYVKDMIGQAFMLVIEKMQSEQMNSPGKAYDETLLSRLWNHREEMRARIGKMWENGDATVGLVVLELGRVMAREMLGRIEQEREGGLEGDPEEVSTIKSLLNKYDMAIDVFYKHSPVIEKTYVREDFVEWLNNRLLALENKLQSKSYNEGINEAFLERIQAIERTLEKKATGEDQKLIRYVLLEDIHEKADDAKETLVRALAHHAPLPRQKLSHLADELPKLEQFFIFVE